MKRISLISRVIALLLAGMFPLAVAGDGYGLHPCPHHDALTVEGTHAGAAHVMPTHVAAPDGPTQDSHDGHGPCTCIGGCNAPVGVALPGLGLTVAKSAVAVRRAPRTPAATLDFSPPPFLLPWATAPPA